MSGKKKLLNEQETRDRDNTIKNDISNDIYHKLDSENNKHVSFKCDPTEKINNFAILSNNNDISHKKEYEMTGKMLAELYDIVGGKPDNIRDIGYVFNLNETQYQELKKNNKGFFDNYMIEYGLDDTTQYTYADKHNNPHTEYGTNLSINNISYEGIKKLIDADISKLKTAVTTENLITQKFISVKKLK